jgi:hypothetical protein
MRYFSAGISDSFFFVISQKEAFPLDTWTPAPPAPGGPKFTPRDGLVLKTGLTSVTRLGEFSPNGWSFTLKFTEVAQIFGQFFATF